MTAIQISKVFWQSHGGGLHGRSWLVSWLTLAYLN